MARLKQVEKAITVAFPNLRFTNIELRRGSNAEVFVMDSNDGNRFVLKAIDKIKNKEKDLEGTEETALRRVKSDYVIPLFDMKEDKRYKFFLFPFIEGWGLDELLRKREQNRQFFSNDEILNFSKQMAQAVINMNKAGVIHQDIKPKNIRFTNDGKFVILDLGIARFKGDGKRVISRGAAHYSSPEQIYGYHNIPDRPPTTFSADHWAIGTIMYQMATLKHPFNRDANLTMNAPIIDPKKENPDINENLSKIIVTLLNKHASDRYPTPEKLLETLNGHEYQIPSPFGQTSVLISLRRTRISRRFINEYKAAITDDSLLPHGILLPAQNITRENKFLDPLKGQGYHLFVDPETYLHGIIDGRSITQKYFHQEHKNKLISNTFALQIKLGAHYLITPNFCIEDINGNELNLTTALYKDSLEFLENQGIKRPLFGGLFVSRNILANDETRKRLLDELMDATDGLAGLFLIIDTATGSMPISDKDLLLGSRFLIERLSQKLPVVLGYGDIFALGLIPSGLSGIVSHPYSSARKINIQQIRNQSIAKRKRKEIKEEKPWPKPEDQFYAPKLLNFIKVTGELDEWITSDQYGHIINDVICNCPFCNNKENIFQRAKISSDARTAKDILKTKWRTEDRSNHFIYHFAKDVRDISEIAKKSPDDARKYFLEKIKTARRLYEEMKNKKTQLHAHSQGDFLKSWEESFS